MKNPKSPLILNAASNLLGLCFIVLTSIKLLKMHAETYIDEVTSVVFFLFMLSVLLSFLSIRSKIERNAAKFENIAEYCFLLGLLGLFAIAILIITDII
jgi:hypothetical protein